MQKSKREKQITNNEIWELSLYRTDRNVGHVNPETDVGLFSFLKLERFSSNGHLPFSKFSMDHYYKGTQKIFYVDTCRNYHKSICSVYKIELMKWNGKKKQIIENKIIG